MPAKLRSFGEVEVPQPEVGVLLSEGAGGMVVEALPSVRVLRGTKGRRVGQEVPSPSPSLPTGLLPEVSRGAPFGRRAPGNPLKGGALLGERHQEVWSRSEVLYLRCPLPTGILAQKVRRSEGQASGGPP
jgi:hypothetical protein